MTAQRAQKRILVAVDGDGSSDSALAMAARLATDEGADLRILHVVDPTPKSVGLILPDLEEAADEARAEGREVIDRAWIAALRAGVRAEQVLVERPVENASGAILLEAANWPADLILVGTHGRTGLARILHGSVSARVAQYAPCPVLVVRPVEAASAR